MATQECPCGHLGDPRKACVCSPQQIAKYLGKLSGPLLDRIDIHVEVPSLGYEELSNHETAESSQAIRARVNHARKLQSARFTIRSKGPHCNAQMGPKHLRNHCRLDAPSHKMLKMAVEKLGLSARAYDRILKVARTIADLEDSEAIKAEHLSEAIQYRTLDRRGAA